MRWRYLIGSEMDEEQRDMKAYKAYYQRVDFVSNSLQGIPQLCPCGSIMKEIIDEKDTYDYLPGKRYFICKDFKNDRLHYRKPWVMGIISTSRYEIPKLVSLLKSIRFHESSHKEKAARSTDYGYGDRLGARNETTTHSFAL
ncbi:hypothetical protein YC2023_008974 [Brassica napus]